MSSVKCFSSARHAIMAVVTDCLLLLATLVAARFANVLRRCVPLSCCRDHAPFRTHPPIGNMLFEYFSAVFSQDTSFVGSNTYYRSMLVPPKHQNRSPQPRHWKLVLLTMSSLPTQVISWKLLLRSRIAGCQRWPADWALFAREIAFSRCARSVGGCCYWGRLAVCVP